MERSGVYWRGRLTGRRLLLGQGSARHGEWHFRADHETWALVFDGEWIRGTRGTVDAPLTLDAAWEPIEPHLDGPAPPRLGRRNVSPVTVMTHPKYGDLPHTLGPRGRIPRDAVRADPAKQNAGMWPARYFYVDSDHTCVQCGLDFVLTADEQRYWYEEAHLSFDVRPVRCARCRGERRAVKRFHAAIAAARIAVRETPDEAAARLALAEAVVRFNDDRGEGDLDEAVGAARHALRLDRARPGAHYWLARAHELAGRDERADAAYGEFLAAAQRTGDGSRGLLNDAARRRAELRARS